ncbi:ester cyclase [Streptomyces sp. NPDC054783]
MSVRSDEDLVRRFFEDVWNQKNPAAAEEIVGQEYSSIENQAFTSLPGPQIVAADLKAYQSRFDQLTFMIKRMFVADGQVMTVWQASGFSKKETFTNRAGEQAPKRLDAEGVSMTEVHGGKITAHRFLWPFNPLFP